MIADVIPMTKHKAQPHDSISGESGTFTIKPEGVFYTGFDKEGKPLPEKRICSPLRVTAKTAGESANHGVLLEWREIKGKKTITRKWAVPRKHMLGDGLEFLRELEDQGVTINVGKEKKVLEYLRSSETDVFINSVIKVGWNGDDDNPVFVTPSRIFGSEAESFIYQPEQKPNHHMAESGTLEEWRQHVARYAAGSSRLVHSISTGFSGGLLFLASNQVDGGGIHFHGESSIGKSITLAVAASLHGRGGKVNDPRTHIRKWAATATAIEITASLHNDMCLFLDELGECDEKQAAKIPYMLGNGAGKERGNKSLSNRPVNTFRLRFISNGEYTLEEHLRKKGIAVAAGQELRMRNIAADAGAGMGIIEELHGFATSRELAEHIVNQTAKYYGTAGVAWHEYITKHHEQIREFIPGAIREFKKKVVPENATSQVHRAGNSFALEAIAGELATKAGITGWTEGEATQAATRCFNDWLAEFGGANGENREMVKIQESVRAFLEGNAARFLDLDAVDAAEERAMRGNYEATPPKPVPNQVGCIRSGRYIVLASQIDHLCKDAGGKNIVKAIRAAGWLIESKTMRLPLQSGKPRVHIISFDNEED